MLCHVLLYISHMKWKLIALILSLIILVTFGLNGSFNSYSTQFSKASTGDNGTVVVVAALDGIMVHGNITIYGSPTIYFQGGKSISMNSTAYIHFNFGIKPFRGQTSLSGGPANLTLSPYHPIDAGFITDVSSSSMQNFLNSYQSDGNGVNYFMIYVQNYHGISINVVGGI